MIEPNKELSADALLDVLAMADAAMAVYTSEDLHIRFANDAMLRLWGKQRNIIGNTLARAVPELVGQPFIGLLQNVWQSGKTYIGTEIPAALKIEGASTVAYFDFEYRAILNERGKTYCIIHTAADVTARVTYKRLAKEKEERERQLYEELTAANEELHAAYEEQAVTNEELQSLNEELRVSSEELQPLNEELRVSGEELQALNEELTVTAEKLQVVNDERLALNEELKVANEELQSLNAKIQLLNASLTEDNAIYKGANTILNTTNEELNTANIEETARNKRLNTANTDLNTLNELLNKANERLKQLSNERQNLNEELTVTNEELELLNDQYLAANEELTKVGKEKQTLNESLETSNLDLQTLNEEYLATNEQLNSLNTEHKRLNEELKLTNEELLALNEELSVTSEQLHTLSNEHIALNEELISTNEELKTRNDEYSKLNDKLALSLETANLSKAAANFGTFDLDVVNDKLEWDNRCKELFGLSPSAIVTYSGDFVKGLHNDDRKRILKAVSDAYNQDLTGGLYDVEYRTIGAEDKKLRWVKAIGQVNFDAEKNPIRFIGTVIDITEQKEDEQRKNDFIGMVSHELKTPLTSLNGYLQIIDLKLKKANDAFLENLANKSVAQVKKMTTMINGFLNVSRFESGKIHIDLQEFDLTELVKEVEEDSLSTITSHRVVFHPIERTIITGDRDKIGQVINNLIGNAVKYSPQNTEIDISCISANGYAKVSIADQGMGIAEKDLSKLFDRYYRVEGNHMKSISGFGIGLYLSCEIIKRHDGEIGAESQIGEGSTFWFKLPLHSGNHNG